VATVVTSPRHLVCLTFDFDTTSLFIAKGLTTPTPLSRGEFGAVASERILALLRRQQIRSTWFVPGHTIASFPAACERVAAAGHEIGNHGWTHVPPAELTPAQEEDELLRASELIVGLTGAAPRGYRSPSWDLSEATVRLLVQHGFVYDSSMMGHDHDLYLARDGDHGVLGEALHRGAPTELVEVPVSWSLDDFPHFEPWGPGTPGLRAASAVEENWWGDFDWMRTNVDWGVMTLTLHPFVIGRGHRMLMLERLIERMREAGAAFVTMEQAVAEWRERQAA
jgi:peptidoglycan/xylan/chitin deacetylase (PgdA/CDA1 family)